MTGEELLDAAGTVIKSGTPDGVRASMRLVQAAQTMSQAQLLILFQNVQNDLIKELARLTERELVTYHTEAALLRVNETIARLQGQAVPQVKTLVYANILAGKLGARIKSQGRTVTALSLTVADETRAKRMIEQLLGQVDHALLCAGQNIQNKIAQGTIYANMSPEERAKAITRDEDGNVVSIAQNTPTTRQNSTQTNGNGLSEQERIELQSHPRKQSKTILQAVATQLGQMRKEYVIGRREIDILRRKTLAETAKHFASGGRMPSAQQNLLNSILSEGVVAFVDRGGHKWDLPSYCDMAVRTTSRQAVNMGELFDDEEHDLYKIVPRKSRCPICSKYEGRVYSRSGSNPNYPPLTDVFGKIDQNGETNLMNSYLTIHPNCMHVLTKYIEDAYTDEEVAEMRRKSNPSTNPYDVDPRTEKQVKEYNEHQRIIAKRATILRKYREFARFIPYQTLGAFPKFEKEYTAKSSKYKEFETEYKKRVSELREKASKTGLV